MDMSKEDAFHNDCLLKIIIYNIYWLDKIAGG